jgi:hypothetical protein
VFQAQRRVTRIAGLFLIARGFFFFGQLVVPNILAQAKFGWRRFCFANFNFAAIVQKFLNKRVICGFFWDMFHGDMLTACMGGLSRTNLSNGGSLVDLHIAVRSDWYTAPAPWGRFGRCPIRDWAFWKALGFTQIKFAISNKP